MGCTKKYQNSDKPKSHKIGVRELTLITFFIICAGPYGIEETVKATGPFYTLLCTALLPVILSFPISLICSELGSIFPYRGSTVMWSQSIVDYIREKLNTENPTYQLRKKLIRYLNLFQALNHLYANTLLIKAVVANGILPALICGYLETLIPEIDRWYWRYLVSITVFFCIVIMNLYGIDVVGWTQYFFAALVLTPVFILVFMSFPHWSAWKISISNKPAELNFGLMFSNLVWQCTGFDQSTNMSGEVTRPNRTYPISLSIVIVLVIICFFFPIISGVMINPNCENWINGAFSQISLQLKGCENGWLRYWLIIAGGISSMSVLNGYVTCSSRELYRNAKAGALPFGKWIAKLQNFRKQKQKSEDRKQKAESDDVAYNDEQHAQQQNQQQQQHNGSQKYEFTVNELTLAQPEDDEEQKYQSPETQQQSDTSVPFIAILCVSILPTIIQFLNFEQLLTISAFLIGTSLSFQVFYFIYARHGKYGYYSHNVITKYQFHLRGGLATSICVCIPPVVCVLTLWIAQGWWPLVVYVAVQIFMISLWMIEICCKNRKKSQKRQKNLQTNDLGTNIGNDEVDFTKRHIKLSTENDEDILI